MGQPDTRAMILQAITGAQQDQSAPFMPEPQAMPAGGITKYFANLLSGAGALPQRAIEASETMRLGGGYDPAPGVEAALMTMGGTAFGAPRGAMGAGPTRLQSDVMDVYRSRKGGEATAAGEFDDLAFEAERQAGFAAARAKRLAQIQEEIAAGKIPEGSTMTAAESKLEARRAQPRKPTVTAAPFEGAQRLDSEVMRLFRERGGNDL